MADSQYVATGPRYSNATPPGPASSSYVATRPGQGTLGAIVQLELAKNQTVAGGANTTFKTYLARKARVVDVIVITDGTHVDDAAHEVRVYAEDGTTTAALRTGLSKNLVYKLATDGSSFDVSKLDYAAGKPLNVKLTATAAKDIVGSVYALVKYIE